MDEDKARDGLTQRILDLTLEVIFLLTGEDHVVVNIHEMDNSSHQIPGGYRRTQSLNMEPPPHAGIRERNNEKILELTHRILSLLTGEVPIRCEDVTVHLSMEEWEYVEQHKDLYKDVMMEDHQPVITADESDDFQTPFTLCDFGTETINNQVEKCLNTRRKGRAESIKYKESESLDLKERHVPEGDVYPTTERTEHLPPDIKVEPASCEEGILTDSNVYNPPAYTSSHTGAKRQGGDISATATYSLQEHTQTEYPSTDIKKESPTCGNFGEYLKDNTNPMGINPNESLTESRNPDQNLCYTNLVINNSVYKGNSVSSSEMGKVSYHESDHVMNESNCIEEPPFPFASGENSALESVLKKQHIKTEDQPFSCPECGEHFPDSISLKGHQTFHVVKKPLKCPECGKSFKWPSKLEAHKRIHTGEKPFKCTECGKCFIQASHLRVHKRIHTGEKPFKCTVCGKCFVQTSHLAAHKMIHTGEKPFKCTECEKCFTWSAHLATHKMIHTEVKQFKCDECDKCFTQASQLARHKMIHTGEKTFHCTECGKCFTHASSLARHRMIHTGEKPFNCPECGKCLTQAASLAAHKRIHTGEKPYNCTECGKRFTRVSGLARHKLTHTG